jgi:beta-lactamase class A
MKKPILTAIVVLLLISLGFVAGLAAAPALSAGPRTRSAFLESRSGPIRLVNPLLECDIADDVYRNRELAPFKEKVAAVVAGHVFERPGTTASVYFRELNDGIWFSVGDTERFIPASLRKLPLMLALLKMADGLGGRRVLGQPVVADLSRDYNQDQNFKPSQHLEPGKAYTILELLRRMIVYSDNNAFMLLSRIVDVTELRRVYSLLRIERPGEDVDAQYQSVQTVSSFFRILYNATYLSQESSELALELLTQTEFRSALVAGVPAGTIVAHKFGEKSETGSGTVQLHDCGIVYVPERPYLLCVMSRGADFARLDDLIADVSRTVYQEVTGQRRVGEPSVP